MSVRRRISTAVVSFVDRGYIGAISIVIAGIAALLVCRWYVAVRCQRMVGSVGRSARGLVIGLSGCVRMHIGTRLVGSQGISVAIVIGLVAAADTGRFEKVEDGKYINVIGVC